MTYLSKVERELVSLGAAMGSNCVPCIEYHIPEARKAGLSDPQIAEAIQLADKVRQVPARKVLTVALALVGESPDGAGVAAQPVALGAQPTPGGSKEQACCG